jgi:hypothetical protein
MWGTAFFEVELVIYGFLMQTEHFFISSTADSAEYLIRKKRFGFCLAQAFLARWVTWPGWPKAWGSAIQRPGNRKRLTASVMRRRYAGASPHIALESGVA